MKDLPSPLFETFKVAGAGRSQAYRIGSPVAGFA